MWDTVKITSLKNWNWHRQTNTKFFFSHFILCLKSIGLLKVKTMMWVISAYSHGLHSSSVWSHEETTVAEHTFHWCWGSRCAEDPLEEAVQDGELRLMLHSFPRVSVMTKSQGYLRFWVQSPKQGLETFFQRPRPRPWITEMIWHFWKRFGSYAW